MMLHHTVSTVSFMAHFFRPTLPLADFTNSKNVMHGEDSKESRRAS